MPYQQLPEDLQNVNIQNVNNIKEYRDDFLDKMGCLSETIYKLKEKLKDSEYRELYDIAMELHKFNTEIGKTIIIQTLRHKQVLDRDYKRRVLTEEEKIKKGYKRCINCDALLKNQSSLNSHMKRNICRKVQVIKETEKVVAKQQGIKTITQSKLRNYQSTFHLCRAYIERHLDNKKYWKRGRYDTLSDYIDTFPDNWKEDFVKYRRRIACFCSRFHYDEGTHLHTPGLAGNY